MPETTDPVALLREAARRLRELAEPMDTRRLVVHEEPDGTGGYTYDVYAEDATDEEEIYCFTARYHAEWFATMSPAVAEPLAAWLEATAICHERGEMITHFAEGMARAICEAVNR